MEIEPTIKLSGSAFIGNTLNSSRPISQVKNSDYINVVSLSEWCSQNFISRDIGYSLIKRKLLLGFRRHHVWWVAANPDCMQELLDYLGVEELAFDADNG